MRKTMKRKVLLLVVLSLLFCMLSACSSCNEKPHVHEYKMQTSDVMHWLKCYCGDTKDYNVHGGGIATCVEKAKCSTCDVVYGELGDHSYGDWVSNGDNTHTKTCIYDNTHEVTENCNGGIATCEEEAICEYCLGEYGEELGHNYGAWVSNGDNTHTKTCSKDNDHKITENCSGGTATCTTKAVCDDCNTSYGQLEPHVFDKEVVEEKYFKSKATCTEKTEHYYSCLCGEKGSATFENGEPLEHNYGEWVSNGNNTHTKTCSNDNNHKITENCSGGTATCGEKTICEVCLTEYGEELGHSYGEWVSNGDNTHTKTCSNDNSHKITENCNGKTATCTTKAFCDGCKTFYGQLEPHVFDKEVVEEKYLKSEATCEEKAEYYYSCSCGKKGNTTFETGELKEHEYKLEKTSIMHWLRCDCGDTKDYNVHSGGTPTCVSKAECSTCGVVYGELGDHNYGEWVSNRNNTHTKTCIYDNAHAITENCNGGTATCTTKAECSDCNESYGQLEDHVFNKEVVEGKYLKSKATCEEVAEYYYSCSCGEKGNTAFKTGEPLDHSYGEWVSNGNNTHTKTCVNDNSHKITENCNGGTATCTTKAECSDCKAFYGKLEPHTFDKEVVEDKYFKSEATCKEKAKYYYSCSCGEKGNTTFGIGELEEHDYQIKEDRPHTDPESYGTLVMACTKCKDSYERKYFGHSIKGCDLAPLFNQKPTSLEECAYCHDISNHTCPCGTVCDVNVFYRHLSEDKVAIYGSYYYLNASGGKVIYFPTTNATSGPNSGPKVVLATIFAGKIVSEVDASAFNISYYRHTLYFPGLVESIGNYVAAYNNVMVGIWLPKTLTYIGSNAFYSSERMAKIYYEGTCLEFEQIVKGSDWLSAQVVDQYPGYYAGGEGCRLIASDGEVLLN